MITNCKDFILNEFLDYLRNWLIVLGENYEYQKDLENLFKSNFKDLPEESREEIIEKIMNASDGENSDIILDFLKEGLKKNKNLLDNYISIAEDIIRVTNFGEWTDPSSEYTMGTLFATKEIVKKCKRWL